MDSKIQDEVMAALRELRQERITACRRADLVPYASILRRIGRGRDEMRDDMTELWRSGRIVVERGINDLLIKEGPNGKRSK